MIENEEQDPISFRVLDCDVHDVLIFLTYLLCTKHVFRSF